MHYHTLFHNININVHYTVPGDYSITPETLMPTLAAGTSTVIIYIAIINDTIFEGKQSFELSLSSVSTPNVIFHSNNQTTVYILDDDMITVFFSSNNFTAMESVGVAVVGVNSILPSGGTEVEFSVGTTITPGTARGEKDNKGVTNQLAYSIKL